MRQYLISPGFLLKNRIESLINSLRITSFFSFISIIIFWGIPGNGLAQDTSWTIQNRQDLAGQYQRTKKEINIETGALTVSQRNFKESANAWSIAEVMEHLNIWHLITQDQVRYMFYNGARPELAKICPSDSAITSFIYEEKKHTAPDISIPTNTIPDKSNLALFNAYIDRIINNISTSSLNFRLYFITYTDGYLQNMNQEYIIHYGHIDRHLKQIRRIKKDPKFPH